MIGLFFGSFNPIHNGHTSLAKHLLEQSDLSEIWFVVSPQNPLKQEADLMPEQQRLDLVNLAIEGMPHFKSCDVEFGLTKPNYTLHTLNHLQSLYPNREFALIIGADNLVHFHHWTDSELILKKFPLIVYPRQGADISILKNKYPQVTIVEAPLFPISSTQIRRLISEKKDASQWLHPSVYEHLKLI